jgi:hypothetical protein
MDNLLLTPGDAQQLVDCCPALQELGCVSLSDADSSSLLPLLQLSALTSLEIGGTMCGDNEAEQLAKLTGELAAGGQQSALLSVQAHCMVPP